MVCDSLHIICGNCGTLLTMNNKRNEKACVSVERDYKGNLEDIYITCENCGTIHSLSQYIRLKDGE